MSQALRIGVRNQNAYFRAIIATGKLMEFRQLRIKTDPPVVRYLPEEQYGVTRVMSEIPHVFDLAKP